MKTIFKSTIAILILQTFSGFAQQKITISNPYSADRVDEQIVIKKSSIKKISKGKTPVLLDEKGKQIPSQADDLDGDGVWDEISLVINVAQKSKKTLTVKFVTQKEITNHTRRAHAGLWLSENRDNNFKLVKNEIRPKAYIAQSMPLRYLMEGPGWENELVAFRSYFDSRNGKDIFGKITSDTVIGVIGRPGNDYHAFSTWGMDVLKVGKSLGAGAIAILDGGKLYRLGQTDQATYQLLADGPCRSIISLTYNGWEVNGKTYSLTEEITIWAGKYWFESNLLLKGNNEDAILVTGIVNMKGDKKIYSERNENGFSYLATYSSQSENLDKLGMALIIKNKKMESFEVAPEEGKNDDVIKTNYVKLPVKKGKSTSFKFVSGWEKSNPLFTTKDGFVSYVKDQCKNLAEPLNISVK